MVRLKGCLGNWREFTWLEKYDIVSWLPDCTSCSYEVTRVGAHLKGQYRHSEIYIEGHLRPITIFGNKTWPPSGRRPHHVLTLSTRKWSMGDWTVVYCTLTYCWDMILLFDLFGYDLWCLPLIYAIHITFERLCTYLRSYLRCIWSQILILIGTVHHIRIVGVFRIWISKNIKQYI